MLTDMTQTAQNEGLQINIHIYPKGRRCRKCHYPLSIYTEGPYCQAHQLYGMKLELEIQEKKKEAIAKKRYKQERRRLRKE